MDPTVSLPALRHTIIACSILLSTWLGWQVGQGDLLIPGLVLAFMVPLVASYALGLPPDVLLGGVILVGYLVGNRGFAQVSVPNLPLLPGELALALGAVLMVGRCAWNKTLPLHRDSLNNLLLLWIVVCTIRLPFDVRAFGMLAVRDYALVYYAGFFFLAQAWSTLPDCRRYLEVCLSVGFALATPVTAAFVAWPETVTQIAIAGVPLIFVKGDVGTAFIAAGVFWFGWRYARFGQARHLILTALCVVGVVVNNSRAATVALIAGVALLVPLRERRIVRALLLVAIAGAFCLLVDAAWPREAGRTGRAFRVYESLRSVVDVSGKLTPSSEDLGDKPDNNRFRLVWWDAVISQARDESPLVGLGFGRDLAEHFVRRYYADNSEEFNTRSPHNFLITVFARTGLVGLLCFAGVLAAIGVRARRAARLAPNSGAGSLWLAPFTIFIAACFGVVLEGPMGAIVFWTLLGMANAATTELENRTSAAEEGSAPVETAPAKLVAPSLVP